jgi:hypothetical protein
VKPTGDTTQWPALNLLKIIILYNFKIFASELKYLSTKENYQAGFYLFFVTKIYYGKLPVDVRLSVSSL